MALPKETQLRVLSKGFDLRSDRDKQTGQRVSIDQIADAVKMSKMTVRRFVSEKDADVSGSPLIAAAAVAEYFGVPLNDLLTVEKDGDGE